MKDDLSNVFVDDSGDLFDDENENYFDDENEMTLDGADYILGLGNKKKKAEKKIKKAEKALAKGDTARAEKKLSKAIKKGATAEQIAPTAQKIAANVAIKQEAQETASNIINPVAVDSPVQSSILDRLGGLSLKKPSPLVPMGAPGLDPSTAQDATAIPGSGQSMPLVSGGGGGGDFPSPEMDFSTSEIIDPEYKQLEEVTVTSEPKNNTVLYIVGALVLVVVLFFFFKSKKS